MMVVVAVMVVLASRADVSSAEERPEVDTGLRIDFGRPRKARPKRPLLFEEVGEARGYGAEEEVEEAASLLSTGVNGASLPPDEAPTADIGASDGLLVADGESGAMGCDVDPSSLAPAAPPPPLFLPIPKKPLIPAVPSFEGAEVASCGEGSEEAGSATVGTFGEGCVISLSLNGGADDPVGDPGLLSSSEGSYNGTSCVGLGRAASWAGVRS